MALVLVGLPAVVVAQASVPIRALAKRLLRVLTNDPALGVLRHVDAGYPAARASAARHGLKVPMDKP